MEIIIVIVIKYEKKLIHNISLRNEIMICKEIISAVDIHRKAMKLVLFNYILHSLY